MNRILTLAALLAFLTLVIAPELMATCHHGDDTMSHSESDCECGCTCHISVNALVNTEATDTYLSSASVQLTYHFSLIQLPLKCLERPPKQSS